MSSREEKLVNFVRALHKRDKRGPDAFPIQNPDAFLAPADAVSTQEGTEVAATDLFRLKQVEAVRRGFVPQKVLFDPPARVKKVQERFLHGLTRSAAQAFDRALTNQPLSDADFLHLESIVLPALRPVFDIQNETYDPLPGYWDLLNRKRTVIEPLIRGVGRLQLSGHPSYTLVGTGFVCGGKCILTNRHVAQIFVEGVQSGQQLTFLPGVGCAIEMIAEVGSANTLQLDLSQPIAVSTLWDVALLRVEALPAGIVPLPLARSAPASISAGVAAIIGYPSYDPDQSFVDQANIFRSVFDRKRLQPGKLNGYMNVMSFGRTVNAIAHDCSTLGGNSGSALISADTAQVVGIHFSGTTHVSNYAVPTWELIADPAFAGQSLNFV